MTIKCEGGLLSASGSGTARGSTAAGRSERDAAGGAVPPVMSLFPRSGEGSAAEAVPEEDE